MSSQAAEHFHIWMCPVC